MNQQLTDKEIESFAKWYAYELHKFSFTNTREIEPTLKEWRKL